MDVKDLLDPNAVGVITAAGVTGVLGLLTTVAVSMLNRTKAIRNVAQQAADSAETAVHNTDNISNGFVSRMDRKLDHISEAQESLHKGQASLEQAFRTHLEWHINQEAQK
jgi:gas vesicle protein